MRNEDSTFFKVFTAFTVVAVAVVVYLWHQSRKSQRDRDRESTDPVSNEDQELPKIRPSLYQVWTNQETGHSLDSCSKSSELNYMETKPIALAPLVNESYLVTVLVRMPSKQFIMMETDQQDLLEIGVASL
ncbi:hypothetical protein CPB86DRAFT_825904 [Serendipita vermifera]|nr:hypothetical protein CPB86DRAFT_825904 [Serendipita vermifera]